MSLQRFWSGERPSKADRSPGTSPADLDLIQRETLLATLRGATRTASYNFAAALLLAGMALTAGEAPALAGVLLSLGLAGSLWRASLKWRFLSQAAPLREGLERAWLELRFNAVVTALMWAIASHVLLPRLPAGLGVFYMLLLGCALATAAAFMTATPRALPAYVGFQLLALASAPLDVAPLHRLSVVLILGFTVLTLWMTSRQIRANTMDLARKLARAQAARRLRRGREQARRLREQARLERTRRLAAESRAHFVSRVSHDFRTPLQVISAACELIQVHASTSGTTGRLEEPLARMQQACEQLLARSAELADWRQWESGEVPLRLQEVALTPILQDTLADLRPRAQAKGLLLHLDLPPEVAARSDPARLRAVVRALLGNAVKWTSQGGVWVEVPSTDRGQVVIHIADSGPGLPEAVRQALDRPTVEGDIQVREDGLGVGLVTARLLCAQMGARLEHGGRQEGGTTFRLYLPAAALHPGQDPARDTTTPP